MKRRLLLVLILLGGCVQYTQVKVEPQTRTDTTVVADTVYLEPSWDSKHWILSSVGALATLLHIVR